MTILTRTEMIETLGRILDGCYITDNASGVFTEDEPDPYVQLQMVLDALKAEVASDQRFVVASTFFIDGVLRSNAPIEALRQAFKDHSLITDASPAASNTETK